MSRHVTLQPRIQLQFCRSDSTIVSKTRSQRAASAGSEVVWTNVEAAESCKPMDAGRLAVTADAAAARAASLTSLMTTGT